MLSYVCLFITLSIVISIKLKHKTKTKTVLVFATERKNNVDPRQKFLTCFQFNSSVYSDGCSYGLDLEREGQAHQKY